MVLGEHRRRTHHEHDAVGKGEEHDRLERVETPLEQSSHERRRQGGADRGHQADLESGRHAPAFAGNSDSPWLRVCTPDVRKTSASNKTSPNVQPLSSSGFVRNESRTANAAKAAIASVSGLGWSNRKAAFMKLPYSRTRNTMTARPTSPNLAGKSSGLSMMKSDRCPTPVICQL